MGGYYYYNFEYLIYILPALLLALYANIKVKSNFNKYSRVFSRRGMTGRDAAKAVLDAAGVSGVSIQPVQGNLTDNYNPTNNTINLSEEVYNSTSVAAIGVAAHEAGHACQYAQHYAPVKLRMSMVKVCNFGSMLSLPLMILGFALNFFGLVIAGIALFSLSVLFQIVTLPVEFDASRRALKAIRENGILDESEYVGAKKVLTAAALTYVAAMLQSLLSLLFYITRFAGSRRN